MPLPVLMMVTLLRGMPVDFVIACVMFLLSQSAMPYTSSETSAAVVSYDLRTMHLTARSSSMARAGRSGNSGPAMVNPIGGVIGACETPT